MGSTDVGGWQVAHEPGLLRVCVEYPEPPRPFGYARQLRVDAAAWQCLLLWGAGAAGVALGLAFWQWVAVAGGVFLLITYVRILRGFVLMVRHWPLSVGVIRKVKPLSGPLNLSETGALLPDGRVVPVTLLSTRARELMEGHGRFEVLFLHDPAGGHSLVVGIRPVPEGPEQAPSPPP